MTEVQFKKAILICRVVTVISAVLSLILITALFSASQRDMRWMDDWEYVMKVVAAVLTAGVFLPPFVMVGLSVKRRVDQMETRITQLERQVEQLSKK